MAFHLVCAPTHKMLRRILCLLVLLCLTATGPSFGQQPTPPQPNPAELEELLRRASLSVGEYKAKFKDLTADEEQKAEEYDAEGKLKRQRRIVSELVIYQSQIDTSSAAEYRNVRSVDGVAVAKREERLVNLFGRLAKTDSVKKEIERISRESRRYDLGSSIYGETLYQGLPLEPDARPSFQFTVAGQEQVNGRQVVVLRYQQAAQTPHIKFDVSLPPALKGAEPLFRGRLWVDAETAQLWREEREWTLRLPSAADPLVFMRFEFDYAASHFGVLTPRRIVVTTYNRGRTRADKQPELLLGGRVVFEYQNFRRFDVNSPDASLNPTAKP